MTWSEGAEPQPEVDTWAPGPKSRWLRITVDEITGRLLRGEVPASWVNSDAYLCSGTLGPSGSMRSRRTVVIDNVDRFDRGGEMHEHGVEEKPGRSSEARSVTQRLLTRPVRPEDAAGLRDLYESLDVDDRYWRFFSARQPDAGFYTDLTTVEERGGARFVAVLLSRTPAADRIIGEAGYSLLSNGDGEFSITVEHEWQARLRPLLLDVLVRGCCGRWCAELGG